MLRRASIITGWVHLEELERGLVDLPRGDGLIGGTAVILGIGISGEVSLPASPEPFTKDARLDPVKAQKAKGGSKASAIRSCPPAG
jgi:hypothetical protein